MLHPKTNESASLLLLVIPLESPFPPPPLQQLRSQLCSCRFDLGYNAPKVHGIRVYPVAGPDGEHLTVELEAEWHSLADIALTASFSAETILLGPIKSVVNLLSNLLPVTVSTCFACMLCRQKTAAPCGRIAVYHLQGDLALHVLFRCSMCIGSACSA